MRILVAMDSFKGSCTSYNAGEAVCRGIKKIVHDATVVNVPVADGGEGTVDAVIVSGHGEKRTCRVTDPLGNKITAQYGVLPSGTAVIEMSAASGLLLVPKEKRNPMLTTTYGTGEMIKAVLDEGYTSILIGIGGSATNDGGAGMLRALGVSLLDANGKELGFGGEQLLKLHKIDMSGIDPRFRNCRITIASDVANPLCGPDGASYMYGPQKGATPEMVNILDTALANYASIIKAQFGIDVANIPGSGAAGGVGTGFLAFTNAKFKMGIEAVLGLINFDKQLQGTDIVFTGEGRIDEQTAYGKVPVGIAGHAKQICAIPVVAIAGGIGKGSEAALSRGIDAIFSVADGPITLEESQERVEELLECAAESVMRAILIGNKIRSSFFC